MDVDRLDRIAAGEMDAVEILRQLQEVAEALPVARPPAAVEVHRVRWARHVDEEHLVAAHRHGVRRVARRDGEGGGGFRDLLHHERAIHAHALFGHFDVAAGLLEDVERLLVQEEDADLLQDAHGAVMDARDALFVERLDRPVAIVRDRPRHLMDSAAARTAQISGAPAGAPRAPLRRLFARIEHSTPSMPDAADAGPPESVLRQCRCAQPLVRYQSGIDPRKRSERDIC